jgi:hypothetical protein
MAQMEVGVNGIVATPLPTASVESAEGKVRLGRYREQYTVSPCPTKHLLADEGAYFVGSGQAPGTTVLKSALTVAFSNVLGLVHIFNTSIAGGKRIYVDYLKLILAGTAPATTVSMEFAMAIDTVTREPAAAGRALWAVKNANGDSATPSVAQASQFLAAGAFTVPAPSANVRYTRAHIPTGLGITGDEYLLKFGGEDKSATQGMTATRAAATARLVGYAPPLIIGPQQSLVIHQWWLTETTNNSNFELEMGWWEK